MKTVKFVGGPFHGSEHEIADNIVELRLPILTDSNGNVDYLRYIQPKADEFVFDSREAGEPIENKSILTNPHIVRSRYYTFELVKLDETEFKGPPREPDTCDYKIVIKQKHTPSDTSFVTTFKIWQWYDHFTLEPSNESKYDVHFINVKENKFDVDFIWGLGKLLEKNGYIGFKG